MVVVSMFLLYKLYQYAGTRTTYPTGLTIGGVDIGQMTEEEARAALSEQYLDAPVTLFHGEDSFEPVSYTHLDVYKRQGFDTLLDPESLGTQEVYRLVSHDDTQLRVLTVPFYDRGGQLMGYIQVARLLDNFEVFSRVLSRALLINMGAAFASLGVLYLLTSTLFRPLEDITTVARQITRADDLSRRVPHSLSLIHI